MEKKPFVSVIIAAAGSSSRMNGVNKLFSELCGVPVIVMTLRKFADLSLVDEIIVTTREDYIKPVSDLIKIYSIKNVKAIVPGGNTRSESIYNAISSLSESCEYVAVHDAARPLIEPEIIEKSIRTAFKFSSCAVGVKVKDTIKEVKDGFIEFTPDRSRLWAIHTPQIFEKNLYLNSISHLAEYKREITDDSLMIELCGGKTAVVEDTYSNIKITTPDDIALAQQYLKDWGNK